MALEVTRWRTSQTPEKVLAENLLVARSSLIPTLSEMIEYTAMAQSTGYTAVTRARPTMQT
jgi:hypothetical protein